jgi:hypothetical protein
MPTPITDAQKRKIRALHKQGLGRNAIAREVGCSLSTVTMVCRAAGLGFDRTKTAQAVEARKIDLADLRTKAAERSLLRVHIIHDRLDAFDKAGTFTYHVSTGKGVETITEPHVTAEYELKYAQAIASHERTAAHASPVATDTDLPAVDAWLAHMAGDGR